MGDETEPVGVLQHVHRHRRLAAELARQRPFGPHAVGQDAAKHACARRRAGDLLDLRRAVDRKEIDAERIGAGDVALLLDGVAVGDAVGRARRPPAPSRSRRPRRCRSRSRARREARAPRAPDWPSPRRTRGCPATPWRRRGNCRGRYRGRRPGRGRRSRRLRRNSRMRVVMALSSPRSTGGKSPRLKFRRRTARRQRVRTARCRAMETRRREGLFTRDAALDWSGDSRSARPARMDKPLRCRALWRADETKEARSVVALSRVPR